MGKKKNMSAEDLKIRKKTKEKKEEEEEEKENTNFKKKLIVCVMSFM